MARHAGKDDPLNDWTPNRGTYRKPGVVGYERRYAWAKSVLEGAEAARRLAESEGPPPSKKRNVRCPNCEARRPHKPTPKCDSDDE